MKEGCIVNESEQLASLYFLPRYHKNYPYGKTDRVNEILKEITLGHQ